MPAVAVQVRACWEVSTGRPDHLEPGCVVMVPLAAEASGGFVCISAAACNADQRLAASVGS